MLSMVICNDTYLHILYLFELFIVMKSTTEGNLPKAKFKIKYSKINHGTLIVTLLNSLKY